MTRLLNRFDLHTNDWNGWVSLALFLIWVCVISCVVSSILNQPFDRKQRVFWVTVVILFPVLGVLAYLPFAFRKENLPVIFLRHRKHGRKGKPQPLDAE